MYDWLLVVGLWLGFGAWFSFIQVLWTVQRQESGRIMKNLISSKRPKVVCVNFSPLKESNNLEDNCDKVTLWKNPPRANALDVAKLLKQLGCNDTHYKQWFIIAPIK